MWGPGRPAFFFLGGSWFVGRLGGDQPVVDLPAAEALRVGTTVGAMAGEYAGLIRRAQPTGPYLLGGYCFWGYVAYEVAREAGRGRL